MRGKIKYLFFILIVCFFTGCKALDSLLPKDSTEEISFVAEEGKHLFKVTYDEKYTKQVYLNNVRIVSGKPYYIKEGKYWFRYINQPKYEMSLLFSGSRNNDDKEFDPPEDRSYEVVKRVIMNEDKVLLIEGKKSKIKFQVGKNFK